MAHPSRPARSKRIFPPSLTLQNRGKSYDDETAFPIYAYTSKSLELLRHQLSRLETEAMGVAAKLNRLAGG
jgi:hypothetical protein